MVIIINDDDTCQCGAYWQDNGFCCNGHPKGYPMKCKCGGTYKKGLDVWASRIRCEKCGDYYDL